MTAADYPAESVKLGEQGATRIRYVVLEDGTAVLIATHSSEAAAIADTVVRLRDGRVESLQERAGVL